MAKQKKIKMALYTRQDKIILYCGYALLGLFLLAIIVPMIYIVIASFMDPVTLHKTKGISFDFSKWSLDAYQRVVSDKQIWVGFKNAIPLLDHLHHHLGSCDDALPLIPCRCRTSKAKDLQRLVCDHDVFSGGLIPTYLLINNLGLLDSMWAVILPGAFSVWNMIIARTYYQGIPRELREAADGWSQRDALLLQDPAARLMPVVAVLTLWQFVAMWNSYFDAMIYLNSASKQPLRLVLRSILIQSQPESGMIADIQSTAERAKMAELLKYATIIISSLPLLVMYPFFQKYFDAGIMAVFH